MATEPIYDESTDEPTTEPDGVTPDPDTTTPEGYVDIQLRSNDNWMLGNIPDWLDVSESSGGGNANIRISINQSNPSANPRTANVSYGTAGGKEASISITQWGNHPFLRANVQMLNFENTEG